MVQRHIRDRANADSAVCTPKHQTMLYMSAQSPSPWTFLTNLRQRIVQNYTHIEPGYAKVFRQTTVQRQPVSWDRWTCVLGPLDLCPGTAGPVFEPWCVEVSTVSTVSTECRGCRGCRSVEGSDTVDTVDNIRASPVSSLGVGGVDSVEGVSRGCPGVSVDTSVDGVNGVKRVSRECRECRARAQRSRGLGGSR